MSRIIQGTPASPGIAIGPTWVYRPPRLDVAPRAAAAPGEEWHRLQSALEQAGAQLERLEQRAAAQVGAEQAAIFEAQRLMLSDPELVEQLSQAVLAGGHSAETAAQDALERYAALLAALPDEALSARADDVRDVTRRVLAALQGVDLDHTPRPATPSIILADDLAPSDTVQFERASILAFVTRRGGPTAHAAILARGLGVPAVVSAPLDLGGIAPGALLIVDGSSGQVTLDPDDEALDAARHRQQGAHNQFAAQLAAAQQPAVTRDGVRFGVHANIGNLDDAQDAVRFGAEGVGLLRTEFLYLDRDRLPSEDEQTAAYRAILGALGGRPVVARTLDIGGDKPAPYLGMRAEPNPFLGWRAIRMLRERPDVLRTQLRALLRAGAGHDLRIMLPLVSSLDEVRSARALFNQAQSELSAAGVPLAADAQLGVMIEVPSAALLADALAREVDFFSIGTNDLTQYTLAVDRTNERVAHLASALHPAVLQLIHHSVQAAHRHGRWAGVCGELAGDPAATPLLVGLELDELSMAPRAIPAVKTTIRALESSACRALAAQALSLATTVEVEALLRGAQSASAAE